MNITEDIPASPQVMAAIDREEFDFALLMTKKCLIKHGRQIFQEILCDNDSTV